MKDFGKTAEKKRREIKLKRKKIHLMYKLLKLMCYLQQDDVIKMDYLISWIDVMRVQCN